ncbi:fungal specific transcription factor domain-containing protein, variant 3 [Coprinopsis cinerea AmutBmut pab1-1]|nr:fungal specific transcription factor domain-containing protein, variant 3 [Coprinopsis cinerea AmutBmut pab1-1]
MPQAPRKDVSAQKAQDKESKRARGALSCAECRRLKLKCDKTVPCSSCKRRGCSAICPNGSLITGQGTRFVLADTEKLHAKISQMSDRIRQLEDALAVSHLTTTKETHPLLTRELLKVKSSLELHSAVEEDEKERVTTITEKDEGEESQYIDAFGTLAIRDDGAATFYGRSAGSESLLIRELPEPSPTDTPGVEPGASERFIPPELASLASNFPLASSFYRPGIDLDYIINNYLPSWQDAQRLYQLYLEQAPWFFGAVTRRQLDEELLPMWYKEAPKPAMAASPVAMGTSAVSPAASEASESSSPKGNAHDLALMFVIFCFGSLTDMEMPPAPNNPEAEQYYQLTKACLTIEPVLERPPSVSTVQTLSLMAIYEGLCSKENSIESTWALFGMATKLAQSIGLHRDCARWKLPPAEVQKRRALFWELFITDCWQSLATGRLATFSLPFVDCELPFDPDQTMAEDGTPQPSFPYWKARFGAECVSAVVQGTLTSRAPKYSIILDLDRKVRDMELPLYAQGPPPQGLGLAQTMSHFMPTNYRELTLLYIHRCFFAHALSNNSADPIKSQYAPSFLAGYRSACTIINSVKQQFTFFPAQIARFWVLWTHAFSASVMIGSVVTHNPKCKVAPAALLELKTACDLFEHAASFGGRAVKFLPILKRLQGKAQQIFRDTNAGIPQRIGNDIFRPSNLKEEEEKDELLIFSGKTHTVKKSSNPSGTTRSNSGSPQATNANNSRAPSDSPGQMFADNPSFANVHPSLVNELNLFDGHIRAQIQNAYRQGGDVFGNAMVVDQPGPAGALPRGATAPVAPDSSMMMQPESVQQEQQQRQQQFLQEMENQRRELERLEMERQQQEAAARQQQQEELRRQQMEQQRQEQYRQQAELQQRQLHEQQRRQQQQLPPPPHRSSSGEYAPYSSQPPDPYSASPPSAGGPSHSLHRVPTQSMSNIHHTMQHQSQYQQQPQHSMARAHPHQQSSPTSSVSSHAPQFHPPPNTQLYTIPSAGSDYGTSPPATSVSPHYASSQPPSGAPYDAHAMSGITSSSSPHSQHSQHSIPQTPSSHGSDVGGYHQYWPAAPTGYAGGPGPGQPRYPQQHHQQPPPPHAHQHQHAYQHQQPHQAYYTPEGALRGIAADDPRLQETWQSYMQNVSASI